MQRASSITSFVAQPVGRWVVAGKTIAWCKRPSLGGGIAWGRPSVSDVTDTVRAFEGLFGPSIALQVDVVLDGRALDTIDPEALQVLFAWIGERREDVARRVRLQVGVIPEGVLGVTLAGILPALGSTHHPFVVERDGLAALRSVSPADAEELAEELAAAFAEGTGVSPLLRKLRDLMSERSLDLVVDDAARALGLSTRTLQRSLKSEGTSFQDELREARIARATMLLRSTEEKISVVASRVGVNEGTLSELIRDRFGTTPAEYRRGHAKP